MSKKSMSTQYEEKSRELATIQDKTTALQKEYIDDIETNKKYSLVVDEDDKYNMTAEQKKFVEYYVNFKNVNTAADLAEIDLDTAKQYFIAYGSQQEIRRINLALYHRQFANKLLSLDEIGGYLTSLLTGENVVVADQPKTISDKLAIVKMLIDLNKMKIDSMEDPTMFMAKDIDIQIKNLSLATVKHLITESENPTQEHIDIVSNENLTPEESAYLSTLPTNELLDLIEYSNNNEENKKGDD